jgi:hypothetical protein
MPTSLSSSVGMLRGSQSSREKRTSTDTGTGVKRVGAGDNSRREHVKRGMFVNKQEDLGLNTTEEHASSIRKEQAAWDEGMEKWGTSLKEARGGLEEAHESLDYNKALDTAWKSYSSAFPTLRVEYGGEILGSFRLPEKAITNLGNTEGIWVSEHDGVWNISMKERHHTENLVEELAQGVELMESEYKATIAPEAAKQLGEARGALSQVDVELATKEGEYEGEKESREALWADVRGQQEERIATMTEILSNFKVG